MLPIDGLHADLGVGNLRGAEGIYIQPFKVGCSFCCRNACCEGNKNCGSKYHGNKFF